jgi:hypothetical protein
MARLPSPDLPSNYAYDLGFQPTLGRAEHPYQSIVTCFKDISIDILFWYIYIILKCRQFIIYHGLERHSNFRVDYINVGIFPIDGGLKQCRIGFSILARVGNQQGLVLYIDRTGSSQPHDISAQKYAFARMFKGASKYWVQYSYILLYEDWSFECRPPPRYWALLCTACWEQHKWCGQSHNLYLD